MSRSHTGFCSVSYTGVKIDNMAVCMATESWKHFPPRQSWRLPPSQRSSVSEKSEKGCNTVPAATSLELKVFRTWNLILFSIPLSNRPLSKSFPFHYLGGEGVKSSKPSPYLFCAAFSDKSVKCMLSQGLPIYDPEPEEPLPTWWSPGSFTYLNGVGGEISSPLCKKSSIIVCMIRWSFPYQFKFQIRSL